MTIEKAIKLIEIEYEKARLEHIKKPLSYALYQVWLQYEREGGLND